MNTARRRRLENDHEKMKVLREQSGFVYFEAEGEPPERYIVRFTCRGLVMKDGKPVNSEEHAVEIYLPAEYPTKPPQLKWLTQIFHPNILGNDHEWHPGKVCLGGWAPSQFLDELCIKLGEMVQYRNYSVHSPLNTEAAVWAEKHKRMLPVDKRGIVGGEKEKKLKEEDVKFLD